VKALYSQGQTAYSGRLQDFDTLGGEFGPGCFQRNFFDREFFLQIVYKRKQFIRQDGGSAAAEVEVCKGKSSLNINIQLLSEVKKVATGFIFFEQVTVKTAKRAKLAAKRDVDIKG